ncbi:MAG TPA: glycerophosphodiester phosphodiesterase family protein [Nitrospirales bacterium]|jgi:glycerophosphoryl diester phosphodiesterase
MPCEPAGTPLVIAHRGASGIVPENTCLALSTAMDLGADMVEVDVQLSRDGSPVIFHDWDLARARCSAQYSRAALKSLRIGDLNLRELQQLDVGSWKHRKFAGLPIPTLAEVLSLCGGKIALNLEIKIPTHGDKARVRRAMIDELGEALTGYPSPESVLISSFDAEALALARTAFPTTRLGILPQHGLRETLRLADRLSAFSVHLRCASIRPALVKSIRGSGVRLYAYTADRTQTFKRLIAAGVDGIFTNFPDRMIALRDPRPRSR